MKLVYFLKDITASGGMERVLSNKCAWLCSQGHEVHVVSLVENTGKPPFFAFPEQLQRHCLGLDHLYAKGLAGKLRRRSHIRDFIAKADHWLGQYRPDIALSMFDEYSRHLAHTRYPCAKIGELHFAKHKSAQHLYRWERNALGRALIRLYKSADYRLIARYHRFVVLTQQDSRAWGSLPNIRVIPNAQTFPCTGHATLESKRILALGRNTSQKRFDLLVRAWARIAHRHPEGRLTILGPGRKDDLAALARQLGIASQVELGEATQDVRGALMEHSVLALSSAYEGFGMVLIEAMTCGLPVVATDCHSGPRDIVRHGEDGLLCTPGDITAMADALDRLLSDPHLRRRMGAAAHDNVQRFSQDVVMRKWQNLFEQVLQRAA